MILARHFATHDARAVTVLPALPQPGSVEEAHHRIANSLQLLAAVVSVEAHRIADPVALAALDLTMRRITAIAGVQRMLYQSPAATSVDLGAYLQDLGAELDRGCGNAGVGRHVRVDARSVKVSAEDATAVGVIVSELVGNACKYAYPVGMPGDVRVTLRARSGGYVSGGYVIEVSDSGAGILPDADPKGTGLGSRIVAMMAHRLGAQMNWRDARPGTRFTLAVGKH